MNYAKTQNPGSDAFNSRVEELWDIVMDDLVFQFQNDFYVQKDGIAMGVACSPDVANLYGLFFEQRIVPQIEDLVFYGRYIDDLFSLVFA